MIILMVNHEWLEVKSYQVPFLFRALPQLSKRLVTSQENFYKAVMMNSAGELQGTRDATGFSVWLMVIW